MCEHFKLGRPFVAECLTAVVQTEIPIKIRVELHRCSAKPPRSRRSSLEAHARDALYGAIVELRETRRARSWGNRGANRGESPTLTFLCRGAQGSSGRALSVGGVRSPQDALLQAGREALEVLRAAGQLLGGPTGGARRRLWDFPFILRGTILHNNGDAAIDAQVLHTVHNIYIVSSLLCIFIDVCRRNDLYIYIYIYVVSCTRSCHEVDQTLILSCDICTHAGAKSSPINSTMIPLHSTDPIFTSSLVLGMGIKKHIMWLV